MAAVTAPPPGSMGMAGPVPGGAATFAATRAPQPSPLPREIHKWLQSLDLSFVVKNPKRDLTNGFLVAEIMSRYYPKDINMNSFENGTRLAAKVDNWEQLFKLFKRKELPISKQEIDAVIHCSGDSAVEFLFHMYQVLTKKTLKLFTPAQPTAEVKPAYMRDTACKRLKDNDIARVQDDIERTIMAIDKLGAYHDERRHLKALEAPLLIQQHRQNRTVARENYDVSSKEEVQDSLQLSEVRVKALSASAAALQGKGSKMTDGHHNKASFVKAQLLKSVGSPATSVGALASMQQPALFVKPASDIMRPLVQNIVQESPELAKVIDVRKDVVASFMEQCRDGAPPAGSTELEQWLQEVEKTSERVFDTLSDRARLLVDTLTKSPPEFWKVWSTFHPALTDFPETSPVFGRAVKLFKSIGHLMREADAPLSQQLISEVGLPSLAKELTRSPEKRECLCEVIYSYTQEDTLNHLLVLRALKDKLGNKTPVYISCLSYFIALDARMGLLDEHLLDLYIYYALMAMQSPQPRIRVAGIAILTTITLESRHHHSSIIALIPTFHDLARDEWWEVQAQLLLLSAHLLGKLMPSDRPDSGSGDEGTGSASSKVHEGLDPTIDPEEVRETLTDIIKHLFVVGASKNVLQVGLTALPRLLRDNVDLMLTYVTVLMEQPPEYRQRLLCPSAPEGPGDANVNRKPYVRGNASRMYEERCISQVWPGLDVAKALARKMDPSKSEYLEAPNLEVLLACLPPMFEDEVVDEWLHLYDKVACGGAASAVAAPAPQTKSYIFDALIDPDLSSMAAAFIKHFWMCTNEHVAETTAERSRKPLLQALVTLYSHTARPKVAEAIVVKFLREMRHECSKPVQIMLTSSVESFRETMPNEYRSSTLSTVL